MVARARRPRLRERPSLIGRFRPGSLLAGARVRGGRGMDCLGKRAAAALLRNCPPEEREGAAAPSGAAAPVKRQQVGPQLMPILTPMERIG